MFRNKTDKWYHVHVNEQDIVCTVGHPFYVADLETFVPAKDLKVGQSVLLANGSCAEIDGIQVEELSTPETTYNFEVEDFHTYYVSDDKVLVHNDCYKPLDVDTFMKDNNLSREEFHSLKRKILKSSDYPVYKIGKNPDIYVNKRTLQVALQSTIDKGPLYETNFYLTGFIVR